MFGERIRSATAVQHRALEQDLELVTEDLTTERHRQILALFFGFFSTWEPIVEAAYGKWYADRRKLPLLRDDLKALGMSADEIAAVPPSPKIIEWSSEAGTLGSLYVMEGSTLGGQLISQHLERVLGLRDGIGYSYYRGYGKQTGPRWRAFLELLEAHSGKGDDEGIIRGAVATFSAVHRWLVPGSGSR